jgi:hypothetical protein
MLDDIDRDACSDIKRIIEHGFSATREVTRVCEEAPGVETVNEPPGEKWAKIKEVFHDPGFTLVYEHAGDLIGRKAAVTITINYGHPPEGLCTNCNHRKATHRYRLSLEKKWCEVCVPGGLNARMWRRIQ